MSSCPLCLEHMETSYTTSCNHSYHEPCFNTYMRDLIRRGKEPTCPMCRSLLEVPNLMKLKAGELKCVSPWCSFTFEVCGQTYFCPDCNLNYCLDCNEPFNPNCNCGASRRQQEDELREFFEAEDIKRCPYCNALICNEEEQEDTWVQCICGVEFCFVCVSVDCSCFNR